MSRPQQASDPSVCHDASAQTVTATFRQMASMLEMLLHSIRSRIDARNKRRESQDDREPSARHAVIGTPSLLLNLQLQVSLGRLMSELEHYKALYHECLWPLVSALPLYLRHMDMFSTAVRTAAALGEGYLLPATHLLSTELDQVRDEDETGTPAMREIDYLIRDCGGRTSTMDLQPWSVQMEKVGSVSVEERNRELRRKMGRFSDEKKYYQSLVTCALLRLLKNSELCCHGFLSWCESVVSPPPRHARPSSSVYSYDAELTDCHVAPLRRRPASPACQTSRRSSLYSEVEMMMIGSSGGTQQQQFYAVPVQQEETEPLTLFSVLDKVRVFRTELHGELDETSKVIDLAQTLWKASLEL